MEKKHVQAVECKAENAKTGVFCFTLVLIGYLLFDRFGSLGFDPWVFHATTGFRQRSHPGFHDVNDGGVSKILSDTETVLTCK